MTDSPTPTASPAGPWDGRPPREHEGAAAHVLSLSTGEQGVATWHAASPFPWLVHGVSYNPGNIVLRGWSYVAPLYAAPPKPAPASDRERVAGPHTFLDELEAWQVARPFIEGIATSLTPPGMQDGREIIEEPFKGGGGLCLLWDQHRVRAYAVVFRDRFNRSVLLMQDYAALAPLPGIDAGEVEKALDVADGLSVVTDPADTTLRTLPARAAMTLAAEVRRFQTTPVGVVDAQRRANADTIALILDEHADLQNGALNVGFLAVKIAETFDPSPTLRATPATDADAVRREALEEAAKVADTYAAYDRSAASQASDAGRRDLAAYCDAQAGRSTILAEAIRALRTAPGSTTRTEDGTDGR